MSVRRYGSREMKMIDAARAVFIEKGFRDATMCDIARRARVNRSTLHYYFPNKDVMFRAVFSSIIESLGPKLREILFSDRPLLTRLSDIIDEYFGRFLENPSIPGFIISEIQRDVDHLIATAREMQFDRTFSMIRSVLQEEMEAGRLRKVPMYTVFTMFYGSIAFPFITRNLFISWFDMSDEDFRTMLSEWKACLLFQLGNLLIEKRPNSRDHIAEEHREA